jgi:hypothetical protein
MKALLNVRRRMLAVAASILLLANLTNVSPVSAAYSIPGPTYMGQVRSGSLTAYGVTCSFEFYYGNYGGGFANIRRTGGTCNELVVSTTNYNPSNGQWYSDGESAVVWPSPGITSTSWYQAFAPGNVVDVYFLVTIKGASSHTRVAWSINALTGQFSQGPTEWTWD